MYDHNYCFQDSWATKLPWEKSIMGVWWGHIDRVQGL